MNKICAIVLLLGWLLAYPPVFSQNPPEAQISEIAMLYKGDTVRGKRLQVQSELQMPIDSAWARVQTPALLEFVAKGKLRFRPVDAPLPAVWQPGDTVRVRMRLYGFMPFGGVHHFVLLHMDEARYTLETREWDRAASIWNHRITLEDLGNGRIRYVDEIDIYGGAKTGIIARWAKQFYQHRQRRWQLVAATVRENMGE